MQQKSNLQSRIQLSRRLIHELAQNFTKIHVISHTSNQNPNFQNQDREP